MRKSVQILLIITSIIVVTVLVTLSIVLIQHTKDDDEHKNDHQHTLRLILYTARNKNGIELDAKHVKSLQKTTYNRHVRTIFIIHGYQSDINDPNGVIIKVKNAYLENGNYNIIGVGWKKYARKLIYKGVHGHIKKVARKLMNYIKEIVDDPSIDVTVRNITLIGHSLGAHIAGLVAKHIKLCGVDGKVEKIPVIIGLDPAGPRFAKNNPFDRLDKLDADYVEIIHTSIQSSGLYYYLKLLTSFLCPFYHLDSLGIEDPIGTADFYPNYGSRQTGCTNPILHISGSCEHTKAYELFAESLNKSSNFEAIKCGGSYESQIKRHKCTPVGKHFTWRGDPVGRNNLHGIFYFETPDDLLIYKILYVLVVIFLYFVLTLLLIWLLNFLFYTCFKVCRHGNCHKKCQTECFDPKTIVCSPFCNPCYGKQRELLHRAMDVKQEQQQRTPMMAADEVIKEIQDESQTKLTFEKA